MPGQVKQWVQEGGGDAAASGCAAAGAPALAPLCRELGGKLAGFIYDGVASLSASVPTGDYDPITQSAAQAALFDGYGALALTFATSVKQLALQTGATEQQVVDVLAQLGVPSHLASRARGPSWAPVEWHGEPYAAPARPDDYWRDDDGRLSPTIMPFRPSPTPQPPLWYVNRIGDENDGLIGLSTWAVQSALRAMQAYAQRLLEVLPLAAAELALRKPRTQFVRTQFTGPLQQGTRLGLLAPSTEALPAHRAPVPVAVRSWKAASARLAGAAAAIALAGFALEVLA